VTSADNARGRDYHEIDEREISRRARLEHDSRIHGIMFSPTFLLQQENVAQIAARTGGGEEREMREDVDESEGEGRKLIDSRDPRTALASSEALEALEWTKSRRDHSGGRFESGMDPSRAGQVRGTRQRPVRKIPAPFSPRDAASLHRPRAASRADISALFGSFT